MKYTIDGNQVCCMRHEHSNLAVDSAGFGDSLKEAFLDLIHKAPITESDDLTDWEGTWLILKEAAEAHELK